MKRKFLSIAILAVLLSLLFIHGAFAHEIKVFAPLSYGGVAPSSPTPFMAWNASGTPGSIATIDPNEGVTTLNAIPNPPNPGIAVSWFDTGWLNYTGPTQDGSVTADTWLHYLLPKWGAGVFAYLWVFEENLVPLSFQYWTARAGDGLPSSTFKNSSFDLGVTPMTTSNIGNQFAWTNNRLYDARVVLGTVAPTGTETLTNGKFDDILFIGYTDSLEDEWALPYLPGLRPPPVINLNDTIGPAGTGIGLQGQGFTPGPYTIYFDSNPVPLVIQLSNASGFIFASFNILGNVTFGIHAITAIDSSNNTATTFFDVFVPVSWLVGDLNGDGKINLQDVVTLAMNYGKTDPNIMAAPGAIVVPAVQTPPAQQASVGLLAVGLAAAGSLTMSKRRKKRQVKR